jgi:catechol 2,3-dioxygenase-like lactoylglutathione lyase family enzyme
MRPKTLDHVALWVADRDPIVAFLTGHVGMHVIESTERFTLIGSDALHGKLTLFVAEGPRDRGALEHVALRVSDLREAVASLPDGLPADTPRAGEIYFDVAEGLRLGLVEARTEIEYDLDHVAVRSAAPARTADEYEQFGFAPASPGPSGAPRVEVGGAWVEFHEGDPGDPERPLLNHLAVLVDSVDEHVADAEELGIEVADVVDAPNTLAVFLWGPEHVKIEYVEHKPTFSLR